MDPSDLGPNTKSHSPKGVEPTAKPHVEIPEKVIARILHRCDFVGQRMEGQEGTVRRHIEGSFDKVALAHIRIAG